MKGKDFLKIINDLDDELIEQADRTYKRKKPAILIISAACLAAAAIIITISLILIKDNNNDGLKTAENNIITEITIQTTSADEETRIIQSEVQMNNIDETTLQTTITESSQESEKITEVDGITENIVYEETTIYEETNDESDLSEVDTQAYYEEPDNNETGIAEYRVISIDQASNEIGRASCKERV